MRGWCGCGARLTVALDVAPAVSAVVAAPACCRVRRERASDAMAGGATVLAWEGKRAAAQSRSRLAAAGGKAAAAGQQRPQNPWCRLPPAGLAEPGPAGSARRRCGQGRLPASSADRRRPGCAPGRAGTETSWGRSAAAPARGPRAAQHGRDRARRDADPGSPDPQPLQLTLDAHVAPLGVLPRQPFDQTLRLGRKRGTTEPARPLLPISLQQRPVPPAKRLRADRKAGPPFGRQQAARRGEKGSVGVRVPRPLPRASEDRQLVAQHDDLKLPLTATADKHRNENAQEPVEHGHQHEAQSEPAPPRSPVNPSPAESTFFTPHVIGLRFPVSAASTGSSHSSIPAAISSQLSADIIRRGRPAGSP
jgi:hypothetical protein